jgi:hypothetical protein
VAFQGHEGSNKGWRVGEDGKDERHVPRVHEGADEEGRCQLEGGREGGDRSEARGRARKGRCLGASDKREAQVEGSRGLGQREGDRGVETKKVVADASEVVRWFIEEAPRTQPGV